MAASDDVDDTTAAEVGHALVRFFIDEDPAGVMRFAPNLDATTIDDAKAARIGRSIVAMLQQLDVA